MYWSLGLQQVNFWEYNSAHNKDRRNSDGCLLCSGPFIEARSCVDLSAPGMPSRYQVISDRNIPSPSLKMAKTHRPIKAHKMLLFLPAFSESYILLSSLSSPHCRTSIAPLLWAQIIAWCLYFLMSLLLMSYFLFRHSSVRQGPWGKISILCILRVFAQ